ncbi:MAG: hypothetical protein Q4G24_08120 [Paracoccus sp. (in: a-proteobacteria)]|uniref:glycosyltransferase family 2 protein n=1 Tax=Paracoccus sp. TaxID=267 RepID=UPI0026DF8311|nr:glycosyltransferase family 2 protein [Paracoccus sp. (in: a-proteobacteria)]MDO5621419.1 hypothetical protein [Paracoccus sp. (in: a-proteobacteria)]
MTHPALNAWLNSNPEVLAKGPLAILLFEDEVETISTLDHHLRNGFRHILALSPQPLDIPETLQAKVTNLQYDTRRPASHVDAINAINDAVPAGTWLFYAYNAEYLFFPFSETRTVGEMLTFHTEERRPAMLAYVVDLYARDLTAAPDAVSLTDAMFDRTGYFALGRKNHDGHDMERQLDFFGGLRWRFEEYLPVDRRRIDRIALFRSAKGLRVTPDHRFSIEEYNTYACPWHHNLTAAIASFRVAKALVRNPGSRDEISDFTWRNAHPFRWNAHQLMELGLMEPGQWF